MTVTTNTVCSLAGPDPSSSLQEERAQAKFDPVQMNYFLEGSKARAENAKRLMQQMERDPVLSVDASYYDLTKDEQREQTALRLNRLSRYIEQDSTDDFKTRMSLFSVFDPQTGTRIGINLGLFLGCIRGNGTKEQLHFWAHKKETVKVRHMYGCFGMTELAHGSNVAGLETTATFDKETDEFVINTPHIGATKWWIGGAAHSSSHCAVYARLIVDGKDYGVKTFIVPLRDSNHDIMPGVSVGDIGSKMGREGIDNGWIQFSSVRIPRFFMLQKFCKVTREGEVSLPPLEQLAYSALLDGRVSMVKDSFRISSRMVTIALRYAIGRRQFKAGKGSKDGLENQLLNYPLHQRRLLPYLALAYVFSAGSLKLENTIHTTLDTLDAAVDAGDLLLIKKSINDMKSLFIDSGSLKSTATWATAELIDQCRQSCGGHGYSAYSGFGKCYDDWVVQCTWEGDNSVLAMSVGKPVIKQVMEVVENNKKIQGSTSFLSNLKQHLNENAVLQSIDDARDTKKAIYALEVLLMRLSFKAYQVLKENNGDFDTIGAESLVISKLKAHHYCLLEFAKRVDSLENRQLVPYLQSLGKLYFASIVFEKFSGEFLAHNIISTKVAADVSSKLVPVLCAEIRPHVVPLTDSFQYSDMLINSAIASYDGNIYENYLHTVKTLNPPSVTKAPYSSSLEAMLGRPSIEVRERSEKSSKVASILSK